MSQLVKQTAVFALALALVPLIQAGTFSTDFSSGTPSGSRLMGHAEIGDSNGFGDSGVLKLTTARRNQQGSFVIEALDGTNLVTGFTMKFKVFIGSGTGADGFGFSFGGPLPEKSFAERGYGNGLTVTFDTYKPGGRGKPDIAIRANGKTIHEEEFPYLRTHRFVDVTAKLTAKGTFDLTYDGHSVCSNLHVGKIQMIGTFGFGSRTVTYTDNHFIDDLQITTDSLAPAFVTSFQPADDNASPSTTIEISVLHRKPEISRESVVFLLDEKVVVPTVEKLTYGASKIYYSVPELLEPGSTHSVSFSLVDENPIRSTNSFSFEFKVSNQVAISRPSANLVK